MFGPKKVLVAQLCLTLWDPMYCSPPGSSVHGLQAGISEWVAFPSSRGSSQRRDWTHFLCIAGRFSTIWATKEAPRILEWAAIPFSRGPSYIVNTVLCVCVCVFLKEWINRRYCQTLLMKRRVNFWGHLWSRSWVVQSDGVDWEQDIWWRIRTWPDPRVPGRNQLLTVLAFLKSNDLLFTSVLLF